MFTSNPFADITEFLSPLTLQLYVVLMVFAVAAGTLYDMLHKSSAKFFAQHVEKSKAAATRKLSGVQTATLAAKTLAIEVASAGEFCNPQRRISHLFMFYGVLLYFITTVVMVFGFPTHASPTPVILPVLWHLGVVMILIGGYWFFFLLRVNVAKDGQPVFRLVYADIFIVTLLSSVTFALIWRIAQTGGNPTATKVTFGLYILFTTMLFVSVPWSKFAHMFYKPVVAYQRRVEEANGSSSLPSPAAGNEGS
jgi:hypothetical protein